MHVFDQSWWLCNDTRWVLDDRVFGGADLPPPLKFAKKSLMTTAWERVRCVVFIDLPI